MKEILKIIKRMVKEQNIIKIIKKDMKECLKMGNIMEMEKNIMIMKY